ncbi:hypothetical protein HUJ04_000767 [Dendroctonus ponderosae]|uniref:FGFR1 oncogene partner (FOP) N-terminal dimerisation domain-containing protein n=1 Tax=Dendroctonus ponderosae TaxID=77166 RepID=A0AAR5PEF4_DENPD|nr:hypothetical protein HUJ04_000767 [Dendroctonus ponderosae]
MSVLEEDVELRDLMTQTLEKNGCLAKIRAELRASVFLALEEDIKLNKQQPLQNLRVQSYLETPEGRAMFYLVGEFLEFFNLQFTLSVYESESYMNAVGHYQEKRKLAKELGLDVMEESTVPLLQQVLKLAQSKSNVLDINLNLNGTPNGSYKEESSNVDSIYRKTDVNCSKSSAEMQTSNDNMVSGKFNATFDVNSPRLTDVLNKENPLTTGDSYDNSDILKYLQCNKKNELNGKLNDTYIKSPTICENLPNNDAKASIDISIPLHKGLKDIKEDDTYEDTSSIAEDSEASEKPISSNISIESVPLKSPSMSENVSQKMNNSKSMVDKSKLGQKPKASLNSLSDLPPLQLNISRKNNDILPSLYNKD